MQSSQIFTSFFASGRQAARGIDPLTKILRTFLMLWRFCYASSVTQTFQTPCLHLLLQPVVQPAAKCIMRTLILAHLLADRVKANSHRHTRHDWDRTVLSCPAGGVNWALAGKVMQSVRLFPLQLLSQLTFDLIVRVHGSRLKRSRRQLSVL